MGVVLVVIASIGENDGWQKQINVLVRTIKQDLHSSKINKEFT
jgi:hypothetical protein